jgi:hypothetical protein
MAPLHDSEPVDLGIRVFECGRSQTADTCDWYRVEVTLNSEQHFEGRLVDLDLACVRGRSGLVSRLARG